ncbi:MAG: HEAT repeat domain-containing protein, partial [Asgard group archaeon]|nr:HEAT repeat domain-containing protein [Asgard group archaeon]
QAAITLGEKKAQEAVKPLLRALKDQDENLRREAIRALKEIGDEEVVPELCQSLLNDTSHEVRAESAYALAYFSSSYDNVESLFTALFNDNHYIVRQNVAFALGKIERRLSIKHLIKALKEDPNYNVRKMAAWALGKMPDKRSLYPLLNALNDEKISVRNNAAFALGLLEDKKAVEDLKEHLTNPNESEKVAWALSHLLKSKQLTPLLKDAYKKLRRIKAYNDCFAIAKILREVNPSEGKKLLLELDSQKEFNQFHDEIQTLL